MRFFDYIHKKRLLLCAVLTLLTIGAVSFLLARPEEEPLAESRFMLDTICTVTLYEWEGDGSAILNGAFDLCAEYEKRLSATVKGSDIDKINHSDGKPVSVTGETAALLQNALPFLSGGIAAFLVSAGTILLALGGCAERPVMLALENAFFPGSAFLLLSLTGAAPFLGRQKRREKK